MKKWILQLAILIVLIPVLTYSAKTLIDTDTFQTLTNKVLWSTYDVKAYGLVGDGVADDGAAFVTLMNTIVAASPIGFQEVVFPSGRYRFATCGITQIPNYMVFKALGRATISKECNGDLFYLVGTPSGNGGAFTRWHDFNVEMNAPTYTGAMMRFGSNSSGQEIDGWYLQEGTEAVFLLDDIGGCELISHDNIFILDPTIAVNGTSAIWKDNFTGRESAACPRHWHHDFGLAYSWYFRGDGLFGGYFDHIYSAGFNIGDNAIGVTINNARMAITAGQTAHISGNSNTVQASQIGGDLTIDAGYVYGTFANNTMDPSKTFTNNAVQNGTDANVPYVEDPRVATSHYQSPYQYTIGKTGTGFPSVSIPKLLIRSDNAVANEDLAYISFQRSNYNPNEDAARITFSRATAGEEGNLDFYTQNAAASLSRVMRLSYAGGVKIGSGTVNAARGMLTYEPVVFANLGSYDNGTTAYCSDCTYNSNPCTGGSTGAIAKRISGAWRCD